MTDQEIFDAIDLTFPMVKPSEHNVAGKKVYLNPVEGMVEIRVTEAGVGRYLSAITHQCDFRIRLNVVELISRFEMDKKLSNDKFDELYGTYCSEEE